MSKKGRGWLALSSHDPWQVALGAALGAAAGLAPLDSGLFVALGFFVVFTDATLLVALGALAALKVAGFAFLDILAVEIGRSIHANPSAAQELVCGLPLLGLLGLERHQVLGGLFLGLPASLVLGLVAFSAQRRVVAAKKRAERRKKKREGSDEWTPRVRVRWTEDVWESLPPLRKWIHLTIIAAAVQLLGSNAAARWFLEAELPALVADELGACGPVHVEAAEGSLLGARLTARNVVVSTDRCKLTIPELELQLDGVSLLRRRFVAKYLGVRHARLTVERDVWPLPVGVHAAREDAEERLASRPRWTIWKAEVEDLEIEVREPARTIKAISGDLHEIRPRGFESRIEPAEVHLKGEGWAFESRDSAPPLLVRGGG
jgi:uncharacterized protein (DUF2062 family)